MIEVDHSSMSIENAEAIGKRASALPNQHRTPILHALAILYNEYEKLKKGVGVCEKSGMRSS